MNKFLLSLLLLAAPLIHVPGGELDTARVAEAAESVLAAGGATEKFNELTALLRQIPQAEHLEFYRLHQRNPAEFKLKLKARLDALRVADDRRAADLAKLIASYHAFAADAERRQLIQNVIHAAVRTEFERKLLENRQRLEELEKSLADLRKQYDFRAKNADAIINTQVKKLLEKDPQ